MDEIYYNDEIDLRALARTILSGWRWILVAAVLCASAGYGYALSTKAYQASASIYVAPILVEESEFDLLMDAMIQDIATSGSVFQSMANELREEIDNEDEFDIEALYEMTNAAYSERSLRLTVDHRNADFAVRLSNAWAEELQHVIASFAGPSIDVLQRATENRDRAREDWATSQNEYIEFQSRSEVVALQVRITSLHEELSALYAADARLEQLNRDGEMLLEGLSSTPSTRASLQQEVETLILTLNQFVVSTMPGEEYFAIELDVPQTTGSSSLQAQMESIEALLVAIEIRQAALSDDIAEIREELLIVAGDLQAQIEEQQRLLAERELTHAAYIAAAEGVRTLETAHAYAASSVRITSTAIHASETGTSGYLGAGLGVMVGGFLGVFWVLFKDWWFKSNDGMD